MKSRLFSASALVLVILFAGACSGEDGDPALTVVDEFIEAFNAGDDQAAGALLIADVEASDGWGPIDVADELAWFTAQGAVFESVSCAVADDQQDEGTTVQCDHETVDALTQAVDALPVPTVTSFTVTSSGITKIHFRYGTPDFEHVGQPFGIWLASNRPDVTCLAWYTGDVSCADKTTVEEQRADGRMVARYAEEWAAYLEANGCTYRDGC